MKWIAAYNSHNPAEAAALYREDVTNIQMPWGKSVDGHAAMLATFEKVFHAFPDIRIDVENLFIDGSSAILEWRFGGTMHGEFAGHSPTGRSFNMRGCEIFQIVDGKIRHQRGYWDKATMFTQLGIAP